MTTISTTDELVTFINVFTVEPENQVKLIQILTEVTETHVRHELGFVSSALHRGLDGTRVTMYAQWRSMADYEAMRVKPGPVPALKEAMKIATFAPGNYAVIKTFEPPSSPSMQSGEQPLNQ